MEPKIECCYKAAYERDHAKVAEQEAALATERQQRETAEEQAQYWQDRWCDRNSVIIGIEKERDALKAEVERLTEKTCPTCEGAGECPAVLGEDPNTGAEVLGEMETCRECDGTGVSAWTKMLNDLAQAHARIVELEGALRPFSDDPYAPGMGPHYREARRVMQGKEG